MFTFTKKSALVKIWVGNVQQRLYTEDEIPEIYNLKDVVLEVLAESTK